MCLQALPHCASGGIIFVELGRVELPSKHIRRKLSTCLFPYYLSALHRKETNQYRA